MHIPRPVGCVLASDSDNRFAPVVAKPRSCGYARADRCRRGVFTHSYQMAMANGRYDGFDTLVLSDTGRFDRCSLLTFSRDAMAVYCRPDIAAQVNLLVGQGDITQYLREDLHGYAAKFFSGSVKRKLMNDRGGTYVTTEDAIYMQKQMNEEKESCLLLEDGRILWYRPPWPMLITMVHNDDGYGAPFPPLPYFGHNTTNLDDLGTRDYRILWMMMALLTSNRSIWMSVASSVLQKTDWKGWGLLYVLKHCYPYIKSNKKSYPFRVLDNKAMLEKLHEVATNVANLEPTEFGGKMIKSLFHGVEDVQVMDLVKLRFYSGTNLLEQEVDACSSIVVTFAADEEEDNSVSNVEGLFSSIPW